jgi:hypothetical protein
MEDEQKWQTNEEWAVSDDMCIAWKNKKSKCQIPYFFATYISDYTVEPLNKGHFWGVI